MNMPRLRSKRIAYRIYRNPFVMLGLGPIFIFLISYRFNRRGARRKERINTYVINVSIAALYALLCWAIGWQAFVLVQGPVFYLSGMLGIWLFYVQHQFEDSYFEHEDEWSYVKAAVEGSSYYQLPKALQWITGNIGFHHVHHLSPKVPNYYLEKAHEATPPLQMATTITLGTSLKSLRFRLWDEQNKAFVGFKDVKHLLRKPNRPADRISGAPQACRKITAFSGVCVTIQVHRTSGRTAMQKWYQIFYKSTGLSPYVWVVFYILPFYFIFRSSSTYEVIFGIAMILMFFVCYVLSFVVKGWQVYFWTSLQILISITMTLLFGYVYFALFLAFFIGNIQHRIGFITLYSIHLVSTIATLNFGFVTKIRY